MIPNIERASIEIFGGCNYTCQMCPQSTGRGSSFLRKMPLSLFKNILDQLTGSPQINLEGSGEPTMAKDLHLYIQECSKRNLRSFIYTNGSNLSGDYMKRIIDAGINFIRFSCIGYNRELYEKWMNIDNFGLILKNAIETKEYINNTESECITSSYHLITDNTQIEYEIEQYKKNFIDKAETLAYIWKMHNWSGNYRPSYERNKSERRTCGRPFAPELTIRAGGSKGRYAAVTPCCQTLGPPNEEKSILGHLDRQSVEEIWNGQPYQELREAHKNKNFDKIDYCKDCDFLYDDPEVLIWSNDKDAKINHMLGTKFSLKDYME